MLHVKCRISVPDPQTIEKEGWVFRENAFWDDQHYGCLVKGPCGKSYEFFPNQIGEEERKELCGREVIATRVDKGIIEIVVE